MLHKWILCGSIKKAPAFIYKFSAVVTNLTHIARDKYGSSEMKLSFKNHICKCWCNL